MKILLAAILTALALAASATARGLETDRGILVAVTPTTITLRTLDGGALALGVDRHTLVWLDGKHADLRVLHRGLVAVVRYDDDARIARKVHAVSGGSSGNGDDDRRKHDSTR